MEDKRRLDKDQVEKLKADMTQGKKINPVAKVKRVYETFVVCSNCSKISVVSQLTVGYCCRHCDKYNNVEEAVERFNKGMGEGQAPITDGSAPAIKTLDAQKIEYRKLRDESEIRAEFFVNGKTRDSLGMDRFNRELKRELIKNNCYRGPASGIF